MKLLKIEDNCGHFLRKSGEFAPIDEISKEDVLNLVNLTIDEEQIEFDPYDEETIKNQAHRIIYKSVVQRISDLAERRQEFVDKSKRLYLEDYDKYRSATSGE